MDLSFLDLLWIVPVFFIVTAAHEAAHAFAAKLYDADILSFKIWPHFVDHDNNPKTRELYFWGRVTWINGPSTGRPKALIAGAPYIWDIIAISGLLLTGAFTVEFLDVLTLGFAVDLVRGVSQPLWSKRGDMRRVITSLR
jgi:hypothetical protein